MRIQDPNNVHMDPGPRRKTLKKNNYTTIIQNDIKKWLQINKQTINLPITKGILLLFLQFRFHLMNLYIS